MAANTLIMNHSHCTALWSSKMHDQKALMFHWHSLLADGTSAKCIYVSASPWECQEVVGPESEGDQISKCTGLMQLPSGAPGSTGDKSRWQLEVWLQPQEHLEVRRQTSCYTFRIVTVPGSQDITRRWYQVVKKYSSSIISQLYLHTNDHQAHVPQLHHHHPPLRVVIVVVVC